MNRNPLFRAALPMALICGPLLAQDTVELHGYARSGVGRSSEGGEQVSFGVVNLAGPGSPGFRLGNEVDNYMELAVDVRAYEKAGTTFKLHARPTFREWYNERDASANASGGNSGNNVNQKVLLRETWGEATGIFGSGSDAFKDATVWVGRRFYQRHDVHMVDYYFWNNSGDGCGLEGVNLGFAKFHYAYIQQDFGNISSGRLTNDAGVPTGPSQPYSDPHGELVMTSHDFRLTDIETNTNGSLSFGLQLQKTANKTNNTGNKNGGWRVDAMHKQSGILGGDNTIAVNYSVGSPIFGWYNEDRDDKNKRQEILDQFFIQPSKKFSMCVFALYRNDDVVTKSDGSKGNSKSIMIGARPAWFFTDHFSVVTEVGYEQVKRDEYYAAGSSKSHLTKETLAAVWSPQASWWSRPQLRVFVTNAQRGNTDNPNAAWQTENRAFEGDKKHGMTYGAQVEAWW